MKDIHLTNDCFTLTDLNIPFISKDSKIIYDMAKYPGYCGDFTPIMNGSKVYYFHKSIGNNGIEICEELYRDLTMLKNYSKDLIESKTRKPLDQSTILAANRILDNISNGYININGIPISINDYEPEGEYFKLYTYEGGVICVNMVKKYYSIVSKQYTLFLSNCNIKTFDDIVGIDMSKDVRLSAEELKSLWQ